MTTGIRALPSGLRTRPLTAADAEAINEIMAEAERAEPAEQHFDLAEVDEMLADPNLDLPRASLGLLDEDRLVGWGWIDRAPVNTEWKAFLMGGIRPDHARRGLGRYLVEALAAQAEALRAEQAPQLPGRLKLWLPEGRHGAAALSDAAGFSTLRYFFEMRRDLAADPPVQTPVPAGYRLVGWQPELSDAVRLAHNEAFADHWDSEPLSAERWRVAVTDSANFRPETCRVALTDEGGIGGYVITEEFPAEAKAFGFRVGYIALVGTVRAARGHGIASALMSSCLVGLAGAGYRRAELTVDADSPTGAGRIYTRLGFGQVKRNRTTGRALSAPAAV